MPQHFIDRVDVGVGQVITLALGLGSYGVGLRDTKWGHLFLSHDFGDGSPTPLLTGFDLLGCPGIAQDLLSPEYYSLRGSGIALPLLCPQDQLSHMLQALVGRVRSGVLFPPTHTATR